MLFLIYLSLHSRLLMFIFVLLFLPTKCRKHDANVSDGEDDITIVPRSKSSDILKQDSLYWPTTKPSTSRTHFNSLKLWSKSRFKFMMRSSSSDNDKTNRESSATSDLDTVNVYEVNGGSTTNSNKRNINKTHDKDKKLLYERKSCYSSSEKSLAGGQNHNHQQTKSASINPVKMRESSNNRVRRNGLRYKDEPHSSSGNWSASSESGRTSIGSEITVQPKSSASSNSLNHGLHLSSGPPSSIISRRKFLNTSASSSVNSDGTMTPELQVHDPYDDETSSAYSCDTEGYYTSFHVDSGLKPLKEEEAMTPHQSTTQLSSSNSFSKSCSQTFLTAESEYEMFGRGSTSTTTSSAGTVCTTLLASSYSDHNILNNTAPCVPERKSSLTKIDRNSKLYSSLTSIEDNPDKTGTVKRNGVLLTREVTAIVHPTDKIRNESPDSGHNTSSSPVESNPNSSPVQNEFEYSESSDLECVDRIERIRDKTRIDRNKIPSICVITPMTSDDESSQQQQQQQQTSTKSNRTNEAKNRGLNNMLVRLKTVLPAINKKSPMKESMYKPNFDELNDEYVTLAEVTNDTSPNNTTSRAIATNERNLAAILSGNLNEETEYVSLNELPSNIRYSTHNIIPLGEIMTHAHHDSGPHKSSQCEINSKTKISGDVDNGNTTDGVNTHRTPTSTRVILDAHGRPVYNSDSLRRRKGAHTTFTPGPHIRESSTKSISPSPTIPSKESTKIPENYPTPGKSIYTSSQTMNNGITNRKILPVRPVTNTQQLKSANQSCNKILIRAPVLPGEGSLKREIMRKSPVTTVIASQTQITSGHRVINSKGAYVNMQDMTTQNSDYLDDDNDGDDDINNKGVTYYEGE